jgi:hypothetical protein
MSTLNLYNPSWWLLKSYKYNLITVQQDATVFRRQLYVFRVLTPITRSSYNCNYSFWHWSTAMNKIRCYYSLQVTSARRCNYSCTSSWWWVSTPETCSAVCRNIINWTESRLVGRLLNLIHDARTHEYKMLQVCNNALLKY